MRPALAAWLLCASCVGGEEEPVVPPPQDAVAPAPLLDSLVLLAPAGVEVWFTDGRPGTDSLGTPCVERGLEIRRGAERRGVPLLYTLTAPVLLDDTSMVAQVFSGCQPGDRYRVSLRTGRPTPLGSP